MNERLRAGALVSLIDEERPNQYPASRKLAWLRELDGLLYHEQLCTHALACEPPAARYDSDTPLLLPFPYGEALYRAWLCTQLDLCNGEIVRFNQSMTLFQWLWRQAVDALNRSVRPCAAGGWRL